MINRIGRSPARDLIKSSTRAPALTPPSPRKRHLRLQIGEVMASREPVILRTLLGSCVAVCLHDPASRLGGMNHILLPGSSIKAPGARFGEQAMEMLIHELMKLGAEPTTLVAKAFGGANMLRCFQPPTIGDENAMFVRQFLAARKIPLVGQRLGGTHAVRLNFSTDTGKASVHTLDGSRLPAIAKAEESYSYLFATRSPGV